MTNGAPPATAPRAFWLVTFWGWAALGSFEVLLPLLGLALHASPTTIGFLFSVFSITALGLRLVLGPLLDHWPRRPLLVGGMLVYVASLLLFAVATTVPMVIAARLLQGIGSTAVWLTATVLLSEWSGAAQATSFGRYQTISVYGAIVGTVWTGIVTALFDAATRQTVAEFISLPDWLPAPWPQLQMLHLIFAGNALCAAAAFGFALRLPEPRRTKPAARLRWYLPPALVPLIVIGALSGSASGLLAPVQIVLLEARFGKGLLGVALVYGLPGVVYGLAPTPLGRWADRHGRVAAATIGLALPALAYVALPWASSMWLFALWLCVEAVGLSLMTPALYALVAEGPPEQRGNGYGLYTFAGGLGGALAQGAGGWLYQQIGTPLPFVLAAAFMVLGALVCRWPRLASQTRRQLDEAVEQPGQQQPDDDAAEQHADGRPDSGSEHGTYPPHPAQR